MTHYGICSWCLSVCFTFTAARRVVGLGRIGSAVAHRARPFGFRLGFYDPYLPAGAEKGFGDMDRYESFEALLRDADIAHELADR